MLLSLRKLINQNAYSIDAMSFDSIQNVDEKGKKLQGLIKFAFSLYAFWS